MWERVARSVIASHGMVDVTLPVATWLPAYSAAASVPALAVVPLFWVCSIAHLAHDEGRVRSLVMHAMICGLGKHGSEHIAYVAMLLYMLSRHVPCRLRTLRDAHSRRLVCASAVVFGLLPSAMTDIRRFWVKRVVIGHVLCRELPVVPMISKALVRSRRIFGLRIRKRTTEFGVLPSYTSRNSQVQPRQRFRTSAVVHEAVVRGSHAPLGKGSCETMPDDRLNQELKKVSAVHKKRVLERLTLFATGRACVVNRTES
jgi:hypothetical protein